MAITKVINDAVDLNQASDYSGLRLPVGTTGDVIESFTTDYLVVGGGGSGGKQIAGGGGAGGLRTSYNNSTTTTNTLGFPSGKTAIATYMLDNNATDISGNYNGTETSITYNTGQYGGAAVFSGSSRIGTGITSFTNNLAISMWLNPLSLHSNGSWVFGNWNSTTQDFYFYVNSSGQIVLNFDGQGGEFTVGNAGDFSIGNWTHFVVSMNSGSYVVYIGKVSAGTNSTTNTTFSNGQDFEIGNVPKSSSVPGWNGLIDQVRIYDTALSSTDVTNIYNNEVQALSGGGTAAESSLTLTEGVAYDVTVGAGGASATGSTNARGNSGQSSIFSTITSLGGGGGGTASTSIETGLSGGSGGGSSRTGGSGGAGTINQGYAGGAAAGSSAGTQGGGGGASSLGINGSTTSPGTTQGNGGTGLEVNIIGSTGNYYASGGGGGSRSDSSYNFRAGTASAGGGTNGISGTGFSQSGVFNTGGGSGGTGYNGSSGISGVGGSGVIILRYPTANVSSFTTTGTLNTPSTTDTLADNNYPVTNVAYYKLDGDAADSSGNGYTGAASNVTWQNGRFNQAGAFNGSTSIINLSTYSAISQQNNFSLSFWLKPNGFVAYSAIVKFYSSYRNYVEVGLNGILGFNATGSQVNTPSGSITDGVWQHVAITKSSTDGTVIYVNNVAVVTSSSDTGNASDFSSNNYINYLGGWDGSVYGFPGDLDQVRIFSSVLTSSQVTDLYNEHYQTKFTDGSDTAIVFTEGTGTVTFSGANPTPPQGALRTNTSYSEDGSGSVIEHYNGTEWKYFDAIKYCTTNTLNFPLGAGCIASYNLDNNVNDIGNTYNGVNSNVTFNASGKFGAAAVFNGSSSRIDINSPIIDVSSDYTVSMWVNTSDVTTFKAIYENINTNGYLANQVLITILSGTIRIYTVQTNGSSTIASYNFSGASLSINTWYHLVFVLKTNGSHIAYINGTSYSSTYYTTTSPTPSGNTTIGYGNGSSFNGSIDQVRIFNSALTSSQVGELYNNEIACS